MARLGAMILSLNEAEMRAYLYLVKSSPKFVSRQKLTDVINGFQREVDVAERSERSQNVVRFIRKKLGKYHGIKTRFGFGYYFEEVNETAEILLAILNTTKMVDLDGRWLPIDGKPKIIDNLYGCDEGLSRVIFRIVDEIQVERKGE